MGVDLASIDDIPLDLRALARVIPPLTMAFLTPGELLLRCEFAAQQIAVADLSDESEARRLRRKARQHLESLSLQQLADAQADLQQRLSAASREGDDRLAAFLHEQLESLPDRNPVLPGEWLREVQIAGLVRSSQKRIAARSPRWFRKNRSRNG
jgi:hypothetical protein